MGLFRTTFGLGLLVALVAFVVGPVKHIVKIGGFFLTPNPTVLGKGQGPIRIEDTIHCEDVHHYRPANLLFTACEDYKDTRFSWFPPLGNFVPPTTRGSIHVVDPKTMKSTRLAFENFEGLFATHGIDVIEDPKQADAVYIFAVNHLPNPEYLQVGEGAEVPKARSQIEIFRHVLQSDTVQHVRSVQHPLIETPNDIYAESPISFYVTNDHFYREGTLRLIEDVWSSAKWSSIIYVQLESLVVPDATAGLHASVALKGLWNNNGLGHGRTDAEVVISSAMGGELYLAHVDRSDDSLSVQSTIPFDTLTDNPSYYADPYRSEDDDASGFVVAGISQPCHIPTTSKDPNATDASRVWYARPQAGIEVWEKKLLFEDDGSRIRSASAAVLVPIEPTEDGKKRAWLFVTGFMSESMVAVQVEL
ncbi:hypothetical protein NUU61_000388 [Penicillium alfredii]|uniref:Serum paraoxonase/arylesterase family protein n=1 Tax=Penicillium alfredii TaxID=1506179 RepID=A0A9W9KPP4_9EURO|nr:uncharacterized protein NUU61_000388 [Penicillium alfredii]KAJ5114629.1 hypothetical protein NUU61_000388 [Penicillium alfredii]